MKTANLPTVRSLEKRLRKPNKGTGRKYTEVPQKNIIKKSILCNKLPVAVALVKARRKGGQILRPVINPIINGRRVGHSWETFAMYFFKDLVPHAENALHRLKVLFQFQFVLLKKLYSRIL